MIEFGLVVSLAAAIGIPAMVAVRWQNGSAGVFVDRVTGPLLAGVVVGRLVNLALDDPNSMGSLSDMLVIRSGVEFWPGVVAAAGAVAWQARRDGHSPLDRLVLLAPLSLVGYAVYEASCVFRDGCLGPVSPIGLRPPGIEATMLPVGLLMATTVAVGAVALRRIGDRVRPMTGVFAAVAVVALVRSVGSIWLPHIGDGLTRQHRTSLVVLALAAVVLGIGATRNSRRGILAPAEG